MALLLLAACAHDVVREPVAAGRFYPADAGALEHEVRAQLAAQARVTEAPVAAVLAPHAGYAYSAKVAAAAFKQLDAGFERVVILAGNHDGAAPFAGASIDRAARYRVPGLEVRVAPAAALRRRPGWVDVPAAHALHMIEVELPFLAALRRDFTIVPIVVGALTPAAAHALAADLARLDDGRTAFVFSVDLSHYHPYEEAAVLDRACLEALRQMDAVEVARCSSDATQLLGVLVELAALRRWTPRVVAYANSGDAVPGERERVVGYGAVAFERRLVLSEREAAALDQIASGAVAARVQGRLFTVAAELLDRHPRLIARSAAFVTLTEAGALRGCLGTLTASEPLAAAVVRWAGAAAAEDARFAPVQRDELDRIDVAVTVVEPPRPIALAGDALLAELAARRPGVVLRLDGRVSVLLPDVWSELSDAQRFVEELCHKQGAATACWRSSRARFEIFDARRVP